MIEQLREDKFAKKGLVQPERRGCYYTTIPASVKHRNTAADEAGVEVAEEDGDTLARPYRNMSSWAPTSLTH